MRWFRELPHRLVATREIIGDYLGVSGRALALVANATTGVNIALRSLVTEETAGIVVDQVSSATAKVWPVRRIAELGREPRRPRHRRRPARPRPRRPPRDRRLLDR